MRSPANWKYRPKRPTDMSSSVCMFFYILLIYYFRNCDAQEQVQPVAETSLLNTDNADYVSSETSPFFKTPSTIYERISSTETSSEFTSSQSSDEALDIVERVLTTDSSVHNPAQNGDFESKQKLTYQQNFQTTEQHDLQQLASDNINTPLPIMSLSVGREQIEAHSGSPKTAKDYRPLEDSYTDRFDGEADGFQSNYNHEVEEVGSYSDGSFMSSPDDNLGSQTFSGFRTPDEESLLRSCPPQLELGDVEWGKGSRIVKAYLPHMEPSTCDPPLKCKVSTTVHRHIFLQEGDSLQVMLQSTPNMTPPRQPVAPQGEGVNEGAYERVNDKTATTAKPNSAINSTSRQDPTTKDHPIKSNLTHLFSREEHQVPSSEKSTVGISRSKMLRVKRESTDTEQGPKPGLSPWPSSLTVWKVTKTEWTSCSTREGGQVAQSSMDGVANVHQNFLPVGVNYFIGRSSWSSSECFKMKVFVRAADCGEGSICSGKGICFANSSMEEYECGCCDGYSGNHCEEKDACAEKPCLNSGYCLDIREGHDGETFQCLCPFGFRGRLCQTLSSLCDSNPCKNDGFCEGNHTAYTCRCSPGWTGPQCMDAATIYATEDISGESFEDSFSRDDVGGKGGCAIGPCVHGVCVETTSQDYRCFCQPGFGGERCELEYDECYSNPCPNGGTCVDQIGRYQCLCGPGFTGPNCSTKVNMCIPDPCPANRICIDKGNSFSCECVQELTDDDCGINEEVCIPNPCSHGGTCYSISETLSFYCACRPGFTGQTCQDASILESVGPYGTREPSVNFELQHSVFSSHLTHMKNMYTGAVTLACAFIIFLLVVSICHCRMNRPYKHKCLLPRPSLRFLPSLSRHSSSLWDKKRRDRSSSARLEFDTDSASAMTSHSNGDSVFYNMDVCDNQELPLIK